MKNFETTIKNSITKAIESGMVEKIIQAKLEESINKAIAEIFSGFGDGTQTIEYKVRIHLQV